MSEWTPEMEKELAERAQFQMSRSDRAFREPEVSGELLLAALAEIRRLRIEVANARARSYRDGFDDSTKRIAPAGTAQYHALERKIRIEGARAMRAWIRTSLLELDVQVFDQVVAIIDELDPEAA